MWNELEIIGYEGNKKVICKCSCGKETIKDYHSMKIGRIKSCGHIFESKKVQDCVGKTFGKLTAIEELEIENNSRYYLFKCECGKTIKRKITIVKNGNCKSCGCLKKDSKTLFKKSHGLSNSKLYEVFRGMKRRCYEEDYYNYPNYGGRGITICGEWLNDGVESFYKWSVNNGYEEDKGLSIDRIDNNKEYSPENCRWVDSITQQNNRRCTQFYEYEGKTKSLAEWSRVFGVNYRTLYMRINSYGYSFKEAVEKPIKRS